MPWSIQSRRRPITKVRLVAFVVGGVDPDGLSLSTLGPEVLAEARAVVGDYGIGRIENRACRAVVLLELDHQRARKIFLKPVNVLDAGAAPAINGLVVVADDKGYAVVPASSRSQAYWMAFVSWNSSTSRC